MSSQSSQQSEASSSIGPLLANRLPSIRILRPLASRGPPQVDERCFTYCAQTVGGRINQAEPWCRTVCLRRVFAHEVKKIVTTYDDNYPEMKTVDVKYPLPAEGQKPLRFFPWVSISDPHSPDDAANRSSSSSSKAKRNWQEGWYMWFTKSRWGAQERLDLMMQDLEHQAEWQHYKEKVQADWNAYEKKQMSQASNNEQEATNAGVSPTPSTSATNIKQDSRTFSTPHTTPSDVHNHLVPPPNQLPIPLPPFPDYVNDSLLVRLPPDFENPFVNVLGPPRRMVVRTWETIESGEQLKLWKRIYAKAMTPEPFHLAANVCRRVWEMWTQKSGGGSGNEEDG